MKGAARGSSLTAAGGSFSGGACSAPAADHDHERATGRCHDRAPTGPKGMVLAFFFSAPACGPLIRRVMAFI